MDDPLGSSVNKSVASKGTTTDVPEESGWTAYFEDFLSKQREQHSSCSSDSFVSPSLVSDAASPINGSPISPKKLNFKKTRTKEISHHDDSLEDTASSPVNSPKVSGLKQMDDINPIKKDDHNIESSLGKGGGTDFYSESDERNEMNFDGKVNYEYAKLKNRGLCLVPLSMLVNYFG